MKYGIEPLDDMIGGPLPPWAEWLAVILFLAGIVIYFITA